MEAKVGAETGGDTNRAAPIGGGRDRAAAADEPEENDDDYERDEPEDNDDDDYERDEPDDDDDDEEYFCEARKKPFSATRDGVDKAKLDRLILEEYQAGPSARGAWRYPKTRRFLKQTVKDADRRTLSTIMEGALERAKKRRTYERRRKRGAAAVPAPALASVSVSVEAIQGVPRRAETERKRGRDRDRVPAADVGGRAPTDLESDRAGGANEPSATKDAVVESDLMNVVDTDGVVESDCAGGVAPTSPPLLTRAAVVVESDRADSANELPAANDVVFVVESDCVASSSPLLSTRTDLESDSADPQKGAQPPTVIAEEGTLSREVEGVLLKLGLASYRQHFINYGAATMDDLLFLTEDDCLDMEMNLFKRRRLLRFLDDERRHPSA